MPLLTLDEARLHINDDVMLELELDLKIHVVSEIILTYCKLDEMPDTWSTHPDFSPIVYDRIPGNLKAAAILMLAELAQNREAGISVLLSPSVVALLTPFRDPTLA